MIRTAIARRLVRCGAVLSILCAILVSANAAGQERPTRSAEALAKEIGVRRRDGDFAGALDLARERLSVLRQAEPASPSWQINEAVVALGILVKYAAFPDSVRGDLAEADRLKRDCLRHLSEAHYDSALTVCRRELMLRRLHLPADHPDVAQALNRLGAAHLQSGAPAAALEAFRAALAAFLSSFDPDQPCILDQEKNIASCLLKTGDLAAAEAICRGSLSGYQRLPGKEDNVIFAYDLLGAILRNQGRLAPAREAAEEALRSAQKRWGEQNPWTLSVLENLAGILQDEDDFGEAEALLRECASTWLALGDSAQYAHAIHNLAFVLEPQGKYKEAEVLYRDALRIASEAQPQVYEDLGIYSHDLARLLGGQGHFVEAESLFREALEAYRVGFGRDSRYVAWALNDLAKLHFAQKKLAAAESSLVEAASIFEAARLRVGGGITRSLFSDSPYHGLAALRLMRGDALGAWQATERGLGRALADMLIAGDGDSVVTKLPAAALASFALPSPSQAAATAGFSAIQSVLARTDALVGWLHVDLGAGHEAVWAYVIREHGPVRWVELWSSDSKEGVPSIVGAADSLRARLRDAAAWMLRVPDDAELQRSCRRLHAQWLAPLMSCLEGSSRLLIVMPGPLLGVPVECLADSDGTPVLHRWTVAYIPSATLLAWLEKQDRSSSASPSALLVGAPALGEEPRADPAKQAAADSKIASGGDLWGAAALQRSAPMEAKPASAAMLDLPQAKAEIAGIVALLDSPEMLVGVQASERTLAALAKADRLGGFDLIHFATHAAVSDRYPERSALLLSRSDPRGFSPAAFPTQNDADGYLTAQEILGTWHLRADLVTLSGCQTGLGQEIRGEGYFGLATSFMAAGAVSVVTSLWPVEDEATKLLMLRFYENLTGHYQDERRSQRGKALPKAEALQEARLWLRNLETAAGERPYRHPSYWAGFVLLGRAD